MYMEESRAGVRKVHTPYISLAIWSYINAVVESGTKANALLSLLRFSEMQWLIYTSMYIYEYSTLLQTLSQNTHMGPIH